MRRCNSCVCAACVQLCCVRRGAARLPLWRRVCRRSTAAATLVSVHRHRCFLMLLEDALLVLLAVLGQQQQQVRAACGLSRHAERHALRSRRAAPPRSYAKARVRGNKGAPRVALRLCIAASSSATAVAAHGAGDSSGGARRKQRKGSTRSAVVNPGAATASAPPRLRSQVRRKKHASARCCGVSDAERVRRRQGTPSLARNAEAAACSCRMQTVRRSAGAASWAAQAAGGARVRRLCAQRAHARRQRRRARKVGCTVVPIDASAGSGRKCRRR
jgi:hypothetical protein